MKLKKTLIDRLSDCRAEKTQKLFSGRRPKNSLTLFLTCGQVSGVGVAYFISWRLGAAILDGDVSVGVACGNSLADFLF